MTELYSDRAHGPKPRIETKISKVVEIALQKLVQGYLNRDFFGDKFPENCPDNNRPFTTDYVLLEATCVSIIPDIGSRWPGRINGDDSQGPPTPQNAIFDTLEWYAKHVGEPQDDDYHDYYGHYHKSWDHPAGLVIFRQGLNEVFARNGVAYEMDADGKIVHIIEGPVADQLRTTQFDSGDSKTDELLEQAKHYFFNRDSDAPQRSIEALWDAFERVKTHIDPSNKKSSADALIKRAGQSPEEVQLLEDEMIALTEIGNAWCIRHHEKFIHEMGPDRHLRNYLFLRMFALLHRIIPGRRAQSS